MLKRKAFKLSISFVLILCFAVSYIYVYAMQNKSNNLLTENIPRELVIKKLTEMTSKITVHTIGEIKLNSKLAEKRGIKNLDEFIFSNNSEKINTIWISKQETNRILKNISQIKYLLNKGVSFYFIGLEDSNLLREKLIGSKIKKIAINAFPDFQVVTQNKNGEYFFGHGYFENLSNEEKIEALLSSAWNNRRNHKKYIEAIIVEKNISKKKFFKFLPKLVFNSYASGSDFYSISDSWTDWGWDYEDTYSNFGDTREWWKLLHYNDGYDDYYGIASTYQLNPASNCTVDDLYVYYDGDYYQNDTTLFKYAPQTEPQSNNFSFNIGVGGNSSDNYEASISAQWQVTINDLDYDTIGTNTTNEYFKGHFEYNDGSAYATGGSSQNVSVIFQRDSGSKCEFWQKYDASYVQLNVQDISHTIKIYKVIIDE